jgi:hypothetical protein
MGLELPGLDPEPSPHEVSLHAVFKHRPGRSDEPSGAAPRAHEEPRQKTAASADFRQRFGSYAVHAQAELATYQDPDEDEDDAVTAPGSRPLQALTERLAAALAALEENTRGEPTIDVEPNRETATFQVPVGVPVSEALLPEGLVQLAQAASGQDGLTQALPQLELKFAASNLAADAQPHAVQENSDADDAADDADWAAEFEPPLVLRRMAD